MGAAFQKQSVNPEPGCWVTYTTDGGALKQIMKFMSDNRHTDCECHWKGTCPMGPPPMPPWAEFIEPLLEMEPGIDWEPQVPDGVPNPDTAVSGWDWRPGDRFDWMGDGMPKWHPIPEHASVGGDAAPWHTDLTRKI